MHFIKMGLSILALFILTFEITQVQVWQNLERHKQVCSVTTKPKEHQTTT